MADDHQMIRHSIKSLIDSNDAFNVIMEADNGSELIEKIESETDIPSIFLIDITMPFMDGYQTVAYITENYPELKCIALSVNYDFNSVFKMVDNGARAYLRKDCSTQELMETIKQVYLVGTYYNNYVVKSLLEYQHSNIEIDLFENIENNQLSKNLTEREIEFILLACTDLTYKAIADKMNISKRTVDSHRESVFDKLKIKSRVALVTCAINCNIYKP
jgi:DNA-binding NarL/FixJ family response regulator